jgi:hypothetical protein
MNQGRSPSPYQILRNDYFGVTMAVAPFMLWLLLGAVAILPAALGSEKLNLNPLMLAGLGLATAFCWIALIWRIWMVRTIFAEGTLVNGVITNIWFFRQRGSCKLQYNYMGTAYEIQNTLIYSKRTCKLAAGSRVTLVVDPQDPKRVFLRDLYL